MTEPEIKSEIARLQNLIQLAVKGAQAMLNDTIKPIEQEVKRLTELLGSGPKEG